MKPNHTFPALLCGAFFALCLAACGTDKGKVRITGQMENYKNGQFLLMAPDAGWEDVDTIYVNDEKFDFERELELPAVAMLLYPNMTERPIVLEPGTKTSIEGHISRLGSVSVKGTDENTLLTDFWTQLTGKNTAERQKMSADFIRSHPDTYAATAVWWQMYRRIGTSDPTREIFNLLKQLQQAQPQNEQLQKMYTRLAPFLQYGPGNKMPDLGMVSIHGDSVSTGALEKPYFIYFWSNWRNNNSRKVRALRQDLAGRGKKLGFVCIALDTDTARCRKALRYDSLPGTVVLDGDAWNSPIATQLGVQNIPGNILVDSTGTIVGRDLSEKELNDALRKLFP